MAVPKEVKDQLDLFGDVVSNLIMMMETARSAFNRQCGQDMEELERFQAITEEEIALATDRIDSHLARCEREGWNCFITLASILSHLEMMVEGMQEMLPPLRKQIGEGIPFSYKGIAQTNQLFDGQLELLRVLVDIFKTDSEVLKKWICDDKGPKMARACIDFATDHEARLVEGLCLPHAAPIFLALLDAVRTMTRHEMEVARLLMKEHRSGAVSV
jgi:Na+/phosphate symporter